VFQVRASGEAGVRKWQGALASVNGEVGASKTPCTQRHHHTATPHTGECQRFVCCATHPKLPACPQVGPSEEPGAASGRGEGRQPTGRVVGIITRNWRARGYCGSLKPPSAHARPLHGTSAVLFLPVERKYPAIRCGRVHTRMRSYTHSYTHMRTRAGTRAHAHARRHVHTCTQKRTHTHAHAQTRRHAHHKLWALTAGSPRGRRAA